VSSERLGHLRFCLQSQLITPAEFLGRPAAHRDPVNEACLVRRQEPGRYLLSEVPTCLGHQTWTNGRIDVLDAAGERVTISHPQRYPDRYPALSEGA
jgi:hypothetical protein